MTSAAIQIFFMKKIKHSYTASYTFICIVILAAVALTGCEGENEPIPAYIQINDFEVQSTNPNWHGSVSHRITNANVFLIDKNSLDAPHQLGTISLPATVPAIVSGNFEINIDPVIRANGNSLYLDVYPFYNRYKADVTLSPNGDVEVNPKTSYAASTNFLLIENFESNSHQFQTDRDNNPNTFIEVSNEDVFEGNSSGKIRLDTANNVFVVANSQPFEINFPEAGRAYMEVNYKTDVPLEFGVLAINALNDETPNFEFIVLAKEEWNKIYFDMTELMATARENRFIFIIRGGIPIQDGKFTLDEAFIYLDNIKVLTF